MELVKSKVNPQHRHVAMLVYPDCLLIDAIGPMEVFNFANCALQLMGRISLAESVYTLSIVAEQSGSVKTSSGVSLVADRGYEDANDDIDTLMVAGATHQAYLDAATQDAKLRDWLIQMMPKVRRMVSICTGALILAEAGLLNGRKATTHWLYCDQLALQHKSIRVEPDKIFVRDGNMYSSGGVTAGIDLALNLVEEDWGWEVAANVARGMLIFMRRPGGQSQFSSYVFNEAKTRKDFRELQAWIISNPHRDLGVEQLAERMSMSPRNFSRLFCQEIGVTPAKFVEGIRMEAARNMMLQTDLPMEAIAVQCGFGSAEQMRRTFQRLLKTTPQEHRSLFKMAG
ncbi:HTH-type transcriptional regulator CdhR [Methyloglobulus morosus KoM1]|uniref:HTH-type transcriptional regulator CdhR n=1 Tax=Methyloglobulus morosus KoM1 TaxID=1116472 RepID=V5C3X8_9GAMM|nr:GlxA family transcriptional regulator [Methyloglobulus morosus]ESS73147.1 HTH-type transcriptional regulator CdhR [Methyloglobulus morosus KoM1]